MIEETIQTIIKNFDFSYMITVNVLTYLIINLLDYINKEEVVTFWQKRIILIISILIIGLLYWLNDLLPINVLINSSVAAPVFWSWICKPLLSNTTYDYKKIDECLK